MPLCFVIMPFGGYFDGYYTDVIRPSLERAGVECKRADEIYSTRAILQDIYDAIQSADICLADVTDKNPNVSYELGVAHALRKPTIITTQRLEDVPFDYKHLRIVKYDPMRTGWERQYKDTLAQTAKRVIADPDANLVLSPRETASREVRLLRQHLLDIFYAEAHDLDRTNNVFVEPDGTCSIKTIWKGVATQSGLYHLCHNVVCDAEGPIEVVRAYDRLNARELEHLEFSSGANHLSYFFFFKQFKSHGQTFEAETEVRARRYIDINRVLEGGETLMSTQAVTNGIRYIRKTDVLHLPDDTRFASVGAEYISHPRRHLVGTQVRQTFANGRRLLTLTYEADAPFQQETGARIRLLS
ncbi:MAG: hypothetical protein U0P30_13860 [Vicinamibacterales bacterium]